MFYSRLIKSIRLKARVPSKRSRSSRWHYSTLSNNTMHENTLIRRRRVFMAQLPALRGNKPKGFRFDSLEGLCFFFSTSLKRTMKICLVSVQGVGLKNKILHFCHARASRTTNVYNHQLNFLNHNVTQFRNSFGIGWVGHFDIMHHMFLRCRKASINRKTKIQLVLLYGRTFEVDQQCTIRRLACLPLRRVSTNVASEDSKLQNNNFSLILPFDLYSRMLLKYTTAACRKNLQPSYRII